MAKPKNKWKYSGIKEDITMLKCPFCGNEYPLLDTISMNYCSNCGNKVDKYTLDNKQYEYKNEVPDSWLDRCSGNGYSKYTDSNGERRYSDNDKRVEDMPFRPCARCGNYPNENGDDYCIQNLGKVINACCGHGEHQGYIQFDNGVTLRGYFTVEHKNEKITL